jgi:hypothetical protein
VPVGRFSLVAPRVPSSDLASPLRLAALVRIPDRFLEVLAAHREHVRAQQYPDSRASP